MSTSRWSEPAEHLLAEGTRECDVLVIGSGYGGSVAAATLADGQRKVWVLERGREYALGEFPQDIGHLPGHVRLQRAGEREPVGRHDALFDVRSFEGGAVLLGSGLGGGSLVNAGVALRPDWKVFRQKPWPKTIRELPDKELDDLFSETERLLGAAPLPGADQLPKFQALHRLARSIGARAEPAPITVAGQNLPADAERPVDLNACIRCGNCFTGCNYGAKRTLATNLIPRAVQRRARFFTGAEATRIEPLAAGGKARYRVHFHVTADRVPREYTVDAHTVIVAAGTLGSTELLMRSGEQKLLALSGELGKRFSANGDAIAMGWGQRTPVHAFAREAQPGQLLETGPTITGFVRTKLRTADNKERKVLLQDGAVPQALGSAAVVLGSTLSLFHRYVQQALPGFFAGREQQDWVATPREMQDHAQLLLAMGEDEGDGRLKLHPDSGQVEVAQWPGSSSGGAAKKDFQEGLHALFQRAGRRGFDGGDYLANPMYRALPDKFAEVTAAGAQAGGHVTVHPLGGCGMADSAGEGVVDQHGTVFRAGGGIYDGLHVLDGSMLPGATGANPFLTIAAFSLRAARRIADALPAPAKETREIPTRQPQVEALPLAGDRPIRLKFQETLAGVASRQPVPAWLEALLVQQQLPVKDLRSWVAVVEVEVPLQDWLADPSLHMDACLRLWASKDRIGLEVDPALLETPPLLKGKGHVRLLALDQASAFERFRRVTSAWRCFDERRPGEAEILKSLLNYDAAIATSCNHAMYRTLDYDFVVTPPAQPAREYPLAGQKRLAYAPGERTLWDALLQLPFTLGEGSTSYGIDLEVDVVDMIRRNRLQVTQAPSTPAAIVGLAAFAAQWARALVQTHFWSFRGLDYPKIQQAKPPAPPPLEGVKPKRFALQVPAGHTDGDTVDIELHHYAPPQSAGCVLLIHGLAHGSGVFTTRTIQTNLVQHFLRQGYRVWLLDHRLSNRLGHAHEPHTIDHVALHDIAQALQLVYRENGNKPFQVFAHCVGAAAFAMAVLGGKAQRPDILTASSMVERAILHAVHPWVVPSTSNRFSAALAALYKDLLPEDVRIDPVPPRESGALDEVIDRIAATLPWPDGERQLHERGRLERATGYAVCNRMTLFYGREWRHENLEQATHDQLAELVGVGGLEVFRQLFFVALRGRLTDRGGENEYVTTPSLLKHWTFPTLFAHGSDNKVFDPRSAVQAWKRLILVHSAAPGPAVGLFVPEGRYGHMDFLFGKNAARDVYPRLSEFLRDPAHFQSSVQGRVIDHARDPVIIVNPGTADEQDITDHVTGIGRRPLCGPMVQVENDANGRRLVLWCEQAADATSQVIHPELRVDGQQLQEPGDFQCTRSKASGAGVCWTIVLKETEKVRFAELEGIELTLLYDGSIPMVKSDLHPSWARLAQDGFKHGLIQGKLALGSDLGAEPLKPSAWTKTPIVDVETPQAVVRHTRSIPIDIPGLDWWDRWARKGGAHSATTTFLAASCRWPGLAFERAGIHRLAEPMLAQVERRDELAAQGLVLLGDQIYVDATANVAETTEEGERGPQRYREAWDPESATGRLLARVPCWMVVDDHEFGDDVGEYAESGKDDTALTLGFGATAAFQWRSTQARPQRWTVPKPAPGTRGPAARGFWHTFAIGGIPAFAADTRTERGSRLSPATWEQAAIMGEEQMKALEDWLLAHRDVPKIVCSGSVFGLATTRNAQLPATRRHTDDWSGFPASMARLVAYIVHNKVRNVIFLSGDYHLSAAATLVLEHAGKKVEALAVISSGWNATLPFANALKREFTWDAPVRIDSGGTSVTSHAKFLSDAARQFSRITLRRDAPAGCELHVEALDESGARLRDATLPCR